MVNEIELLRKMRDEVPKDVDVRGVEQRLAAMRRDGPRGAGARRPPVRRVRVGFALAAACALAVGGVAVARSGGERAPAVRQAEVRSPTAAVVLENAALVADRSRATEIRPDQWFYVKESQHLWGGDLPTFEHWSRMDGRKEAIREEGKELRITAAEKGPTHSGRTQEEIERLPADPDALLAHFRGLGKDLTPLSVCQPHCAPEIADSVKVFGAIGWYLKYGPMIPPDTAAGMYRALAKIPKVTIEENATDGDGRTGIGVVLDTGTTGKAYYILDAQDYRYMGTKVVNEDGTGAMSVLGSGIVDRPGDVP
ncbi:CU044_5270 family protein [Nonomuraea zeae]|uniref:Uncharacterized protein n=1 Tax=Nonomuraea zeae TaxID=1642303 RepID=A0A5S4GM77_9ACTN|nr:CU044_5270 family protein [Nonomuraea zeae]TMR33624.1 hypothetical protein ETD85_19170 [Nonomuraea zeae]